MTVRNYADVPILGAGAAPAPPAPLLTNGRADRPSGRAGPPSAQAVLETIGVVAAPATLVSALAVYFGVAYANAQAFYFGIDGSTLGFSTQDYVMRSADALFVPIGGMVLAGLLVLWVHSVLTGWLVRPERRSAVTAAIWGLGTVGCALFGLGVTAVFRPLPFRAPFLFEPLSVAAGMLALSSAVSLRRRRQPGGHRSWTGTANVVLVSMVVVVGLFWATSEYARALGRGRAQLLEARLPDRPGVVVYSTERLHLAGPGVGEVELGADGSAYRFRYEGLRLFTRAGDRYFLLPASWATTDSRAVVLADDERVRFEFTVGAP